MTFNEAISAILTEASGKYAGYAITYARAIPQAKAEAESMGLGADYGLRLQIPYILCNLDGWTGPRADKVKKVLQAKYERLAEE